MTIVIKLKWYEQETNWYKHMLQAGVAGVMKRGRLRITWRSNMTEWYSGQTYAAGRCGRGNEEREVEDNLA